MLGIVVIGRTFETVIQLRYGEQAPHAASNSARSAASTTSSPLKSAGWSGCGPHAANSSAKSAASTFPSQFRSPGQGGTAHSPVSGLQLSPAGHGM